MQLHSYTISPAMARTCLLLFSLSLLINIATSQSNNCTPIPTLDGWVEHPYEVEANLGDEVRFNCSFVYPGPEVGFHTWQHFTVNDKRDAINQDDPDNNIFFSDDTGGDLVITSVSEYHAGMYGCIITGCGVSVTSANASLIILSRPIINLENDAFFIETATPYSITGSVVGYPEPNFRLYKLNAAGDPVGTASRFVITFTNSRIVIELANPMVADAGSYRLVAENTRGDSQSDFTITIDGPDVPVLTVPSTVIQNYNETVRVNCSVQYSARLGLIMTWTDTNSNPVPELDSGPMRVVQSTNSIELIIAAFRSSNRGTYCCSADNGRGNDEGCSTIEAPPDFSSGDVHVRSMDGSHQITWDLPNHPSSDVLEMIEAYRVFIYRYDTQQVVASDLVNTSRVFVIKSLSAGTYEATVATIVDDGTGKQVTGPESERASFKVEGSTGIPIVAVVAGSVGGVVVLLIIVGVSVGVFFLCFYYPHRHQSPNQQGMTWGKEEAVDGNGVLNSYSTLQLPPTTELPPSPDSPPMSLFSTEIDPSWEFPREDLQLTETLYEGPFTVLFKGLVMGVDKKGFDVSVKAMRDDATEDDMKMMVSEMELLASLGQHPNIVSLLSVCTVEKPLCMVLEYMCHGDLLGFLRASRGHMGMYTIKPGIRSQPPMLRLTSRDILSIGSKIANGMRFLADRKIAHRALCARNVLVGTSMEIKIYNVGAFDIPFENRDTLIKWMAPETLFDGTTTPYSDVWSFGVTLWELVTLGGTPYAEILPADIYSQLHGGMRMPKPPHCSQEVYDIMRQCWEANPTGRPYFAIIHDRLDALFNSKMSYFDLENYNENEYSQFEEPPQLSTAL